MDEPSAQTKVNLADAYRRVIKDIENLVCFYEAKVLAIGSRNVSETTSVHLGSKPTQPKKRSRDILNTYMAERQVTALPAQMGAGTQNGITDPILPWPILQSRPS